MPDFAVLERRVNRAGIERLANASALWWPGGRAAGEPVGPIRVVFDRNGVGGLEGLAESFDPVISALESSLSGVSRADGMDVTPDASGETLAFDVVRPRADGTDLIVCHLVNEGDL